MNGLAFNITPVLSTCLPSSRLIILYYRCSARLLAWLTFRGLVPVPILSLSAEYLRVFKFPSKGLYVVVSQTLHCRRHQSDCSNTRPLFLSLYLQVQFTYWLVRISASAGTPCSRTTRHRSLEVRVSAHRASLGMRCTWLLTTLDSIALQRCNVAVI